VKFFMRPGRLVDKIKEDELLPKDETNDEYSVQDKDGNEGAPTGSEWMMHLYEFPGSAKDSILCLDAFPKKKCQPHEWINGGKNVGWGVYLKTQPSRVLLMAVKVITSGGVIVALGVVWIVKKEQRLPIAVGLVSTITALTVD
jgi:hypothetical protein